MASPTRPTDILNFASAGTAVRPTNAQAAAGWSPSMKPPAQWENYIMQNIYSWIIWTDFNIGAGIGGGGAALVWNESDQAAPQPIVENGISVYSYAPGNIGQALVATLFVPATYNPNSRITISNLVYSPDTTGNLLFHTLSTLIRDGVDAITSTTNQHISSNSAITLSSGTVNVPTRVIYDVTDQNGLINGIAVSPNDLIKVELMRGQDTATSKARCITLASIPSFS